MCHGPSSLVGINPLTLDQNSFEFGRVNLSQDSPEFDQVDLDQKLAGLDQNSTESTMTESQLNSSYVEFLRVGPKDTSFRKFNMNFFYKKWILDFELDLNIWIWIWIWI